MRGSAASMTFLRPASEDEALDLYAQHPEAMPIAGGTDVMVAWNAGHLNHGTFLDLSRLDAWREIRETGDRLVIGALVDHASLQRSDAARRECPLLVSACGTVGGVQIQNRGTLGGNVANASPAGDTFPALSVHEAVVHVRSSSGRRAIPFLDVFRGVKQTTLAPGELITVIDVPFTPGLTRRMFRKVGTRAAQAISKTVAAGMLWTNPDGSVRELRFALGSMAPTVRRLRSVEASVLGKRLTARVVDEACARLLDDVSPIDDIRSTRDYRAAVSQNVLRSFLEGRHA